MILHTSCQRCRKLITLPAPPRSTVTCGSCEPYCTQLDHLETAFLEAVSAEKLAEADALADTLDSTDRADTDDLGGPAARLAELGWPVFPLKPGDKVPATRNGFKDANTDIERIKRYWSRNPTANIGVPTGHKFDVIDVDYKVPGAVLHWADIRDDPGTEIHALVSTPHGLHAYVLPTGGGNRANLMPGIDYRGIGGYVVVPPSRRDDGVYRWWSNPSPLLL